MHFACGTSHFCPVFSWLCHMFTVAHGDYLVCEILVIYVYKFDMHGLVIIGTPRSKTQKSVTLQRYELFCPETAELLLCSPCIRVALLRRPKLCRFKVTLGRGFCKYCLRDRAVCYNCNFHKSLVMNLGVKYLKTTASYLDVPLPCLVPGFLF